MKKINIKGREYEITIKNEPNDYEWGTTNTITKQIEITVDPESVENTLQTLIHELAHAYFYESGLKEECRNEKIVTWLETQFLQLLQSFCQTVPMIYTNQRQNFKQIEKLIQQITKQKGENKKWKMKNINI